MYDIIFTWYAHRHSSILNPSLCTHYMQQHFSYLVPIAAARRDIWVPTTTTKTRTSNHHHYHHYKQEQASAAAAALLMPVEVVVVGA